MFLFTDYKDLSSDAKILYAMLSDRRSLSEKNGWRDENGVYVIFTQEEVSDYIPSSKGKASRIMKELREAELISRKRMGQGRPDRIYVNIPCEAAIEESYPQLPEVGSPECPEEELKSSLYETLELRVPAPSETEYSKTYISIDQSVMDSKRTACTTNRTGIIPIRERNDNAFAMVAKNTGLDEMPDDPMNEEILDIIHEVMDGKGSDTMRINGSDRPKSVVRSCFMKLDKRCIEHFYDRLANHTDLKSVHNRRSYMRSMLYNSYYEHPFGGDVAFGT